MANLVINPKNWAGRAIIFIMESIIFGILVAILLVFCLMAFTGAPYVPSMKKELKIAFKELYPLSKKDYLVDLGSGDGIVLKIANQFGAKALGIELNPFLAFFTKLRFRKNPDIKISDDNLFVANFPQETTVVYVFGDDRDIEKIAKAIQKQTVKLGHSLFLISHAFTIPGLKPLKQHRAYFLYKIDADSKIGAPKKKSVR